MATTRPNAQQRPGRDWGITARAAFLATMACVALTAALAANALPRDFVGPLATTIVFVLAAAFALIASAQGRIDPTDVTYSDVAGALTLIGVAMSVLIGPDQMLRVIEGAYREN